MEKFLKTYYNPPKASTDLIKKVMNKYKRNHEVLWAINIVFCGILIYLFMELFVILNINFFDLVMNLYFSIGSIGLAILEVTTAIILFISKYYLEAIGICLIFGLINMYYFERMRLQQSI